MDYDSHYLLRNPSDPRRGFFDREAETWDNPENDYTGNPKFLQWLEDVGLEENMTVLEIGCGTGTVLPFLARRTGRHGQVFAMDLSGGMLIRAKERSESLGVSFCQGEGRQMPFSDARFDQVMAINTFPHLQPRLEAICEMRRILKPGGLLNITHFCSREFVNQIHASASGVVNEDHLPPAERLASLLESRGFHPLLSIEQNDFYWVRARAV